MSEPLISEPYGDCWGMDVVDASSSPTADQTIVGLPVLLLSPVDGSRVEFDACDAPLKMGDETARKLWTNTRSKALSYLG